MSSFTSTPRPDRTSRPDPSNPTGGGNSGGNNGGGGPGGGGGGNQTSNLYLYTFLATLLLLLTISVAVVGRSIVIRRRARRMIEEAMQNGTWLPHAGRPAVKLGEKPKLFDVHTTADGIPYRSPLDRGLLAWDDLKPLSATLEKPASPPPQAPVVRSSAPTEPPPSLLFRLVPRLRPPPRTATPDSPAYLFETLQQPHDTTLTVSVMIAMPTPPITKSHNSSEDTFPSVQFGVTHLPVPQGWVMDAKSSSG